jgi:hypothetical protein
MVVLLCGGHHASAKHKIHALFSRRSCDTSRTERRAEIRRDPVRHGGPSGTGLRRASNRSQRPERRDEAISKPSATGLLVAGWCVGLTGLTLVLANVGRGLRRSSRGLIIAAYALFVMVLLATS